MPAESLEQFRRQYGPVLERLFSQSGAARFRIGAPAFTQALYKSYRRRMETGPEFEDHSETEAFLNSLHVRDLALALGCREGNEDAWGEFASEFRAWIEAAARALESDPVRALELADTLYSDLYGLREAQGRRISPFDHYHGRAGLGAWLRVVMIRRQADQWRAARPFDSLEAIRDRIPEHDGGRDGHDPDRARYLPMVGDCVTRSIRSLEPRERLLLSYYYVQGLTLVQIGRLFGEHESTVSRALAAIRTKIRIEVERSLRTDHRLGADEIDQCFGYATEDWPFDLSAVLAQGK